MVVFCFTMSCETPQDSGNKKPEISVGGDMPLVLSVYQVEVVNNTDSTVEIKRGDFSKSEKNGIRASLFNESLIVPGNTKEEMYFMWFPRFRENAEDTPPPPGTPLEPFPSVEEQMEEYNQYLPQVNSFLLRILMDDNEYYMAGWPQSLELPSLIGPNFWGFTFDTGKIVQYGIGYGNAETRIKHNARVDRTGGGDYEYHDVVYSPYVISIDNDGKTEKHDFDEAKIVLGRAVLTIDGPDKINFYTTDLWESDDDHSFLKKAGVFGNEE